MPIWRQFARDLGATVVHVGVSDHVHVVTTLSRTVSQAELIEKIKKTLSKWIKSLDARYRGFFWQRGFGAFSVSPSQLEAVCAMSTNKKRIIGRARLRRSIETYCKSTASILMSVMFRIDPARL